MAELTSIVERNKFVRGLIYSLFDILFIPKRKLVKAFHYRTDNVAIIALHKMGDSVFTFPAVTEILKNYDHRFVSLVCYPDTKAIYKIMFPGINFILIDHDEIFWENRFVKNSARKKIKSLRPSVIFDLTGIGFLIYNIRAKEIIGTSKRQFKYLYDIYTPLSETPHLIDRYLDVVKAKFPSAVKAQREFPLVVFGGKKIMIHPFAGWEAKQWNLEKYFKLAARLCPDFEVSFVVEKGSLKNKVDDLKATFEIVETQNVDELIAAVKYCSVFISNDSGPLYIANLMGKPTFTIYGPTNPDYSLPFGNSHGYIQKRIRCSPEKGKQYCFTNAGRNGCPSYECMNQLTVDEVYAEVKKFLGKVLHKENELSRNI